MSGFTITYANFHRNILAFILLPIRSFSAWQNLRTFFHSDFVKVDRYLVIPAAIYNIFYDTDTEFHMAYRITDTVIQACCLADRKVFFWRLVFAWKFIFICA